MFDKVNDLKIIFRFLNHILGITSLYLLFHKESAFCVTCEKYSISL